MSKKPNVLLISTDHWPGSFFSGANHPSIQTPTLDQLARNGVRFRRAYGECPVCVPARRTLMTGTTPRTHGDRVFKSTAPMPDLPTIAQTFRDHDYQAFAVGKMHVYPQRDRIGFDDVILSEEGRRQWGVTDDYDQFLTDRGFAGKQFYHGMSNNDYATRSWHLPEDCHVTNWATDQMARQIKRRDPTRPAFWFLSYVHPHPPLAPLQTYLDLYREIEIDEPYFGSWSAKVDELPHPLRSKILANAHFSSALIRSARRAFYALCTHIDHQLRIVIGTLREEGLLDNTIILFTADHGDMLGNHGLWAKRLFYENSANIPTILIGTAGDERVGNNRIDDRLVGWQDVMPTLLDLAGIEIPETVDGISMIGDQKRDHFYGECGEGSAATRMIHDGRFKLIYYATGNFVQLFDLDADPNECDDLSDAPRHAEIRIRLTKLLIDELYGGDEKWVENGRLIGVPDREIRPSTNRGLSGQRGLH